MRSRVCDWTWLATAIVLAALGSSARAEGEYKRMTLTVNAPYLLVPVYQLSAEVAVHEKWGVALRGGYGRTDFLGDEQAVMEFGGQAAHYVTGNAGRGMQLGVDARLVNYEGDGKLSGLGDGVALGPFVGYKRVFGSGVTLGGQLGAQVVATGESEGPVLPFFALSLGVSFGSAGGTARSSETIHTVAPASRAPHRSPLDHHRGFMFGFSLGGGATTTEGCDACDMEAGISVDGSVGWFLGRRFALMYDATASVGLLSNRPGSAGMGLQSVALQFWPHEDFWLKVGVGPAFLTTSSLLDGPSIRTGGGGTFAAGHEFHHSGNFNLDVQLRATHGSFDDGGEKLGVNHFVGMVGVHWH